MKIQKPFQFSFPLNREIRDITRPNGYRIEHVGDLQITGVAYEQTTYHKHEDGKYTADIETIEWNGNDVTDLVQHGADDLYDQLLEAAEQHAVGVFNYTTPPEPERKDSLFEHVAGIVRSDVKARYGIDLK